MYICVNGHRSASCVHIEGEPRMCSVPGCRAEAEIDDDAGFAAALAQARREGVEAACLELIECAKAELYSMARLDKWDRPTIDEAIKRLGGNFKAQAEQMPKYLFRDTL